MLRNYVIIVFRLLRRQKLYAFVNIFGLAIGFSAAVLIGLYIENELSYDRFYTNAELVYRVTHQSFDEAGEEGVENVLIDPPIAPLMKAELPEIAAAVRLTPVNPLLSYGDVHVSSGNCYWADPSLFDVLNINVTAGVPASALTEPFSLMLSRSKAEALFGTADAVGKTVIINGDDAFTVTGIFEDLPSNTHLPIDVLGSMSSIERWFGELQWDSPNYATYVRLFEDASLSELETKLASFLNAHKTAGASGTGRLKLQPLTDIHLHSHLVGELAPNGDFRYVVLLICIAALILLIAAINFVNLSTARSVRRAQEVGVRKVLGAGKSRLIGQFLGESLITVFLALAFSVVITQIALPAFSAFTGKPLSLFGSGAIIHLAALTAAGLLVGLAAGSYPAFHLTGFLPTHVLKGRPDGRGQSMFRSALVTFQFVIAITLLISTFVVYKQLSFVNGRNLGFDQEQILVAPTIWEMKERFDPVRAEVLRHPDIVHVAQSNPIPSSRLSMTVEATAAADARAEPGNAVLYPVFVDAHFFPTYGVSFVAGRNLSDDRPSDSPQAFVINETASNRLSFAEPEDAVGAPLQLGRLKGSIVGVIRDFHLESLHQNIAPMVFYAVPSNFRMLSVKVRADGALPDVVNFLEQLWRRYEPNGTFQYAFLNERVGASYTADMKLGRIFGLFAGLAIFINCLGLFGMATFSVEERIKEIGIRKVLGASAAQITLLLSTHVLRLVGLAFIVATPLALYVMQRWLSNFAYQTPLSWYVFFSAGAFALMVAVLTVSLKTVKAANSNPARNLRYE